ncbi:nuclear transport factor 2 family protein [Pollutimonas harenae]|uniref:Nuclear transport factor 2 family protein n=1 Tax=Pollutimonas harenae TaxID=657015 RepID=A0A853GXB2_9BURK|nr:nuclear transport factor 2 family protein [Pollutimonas harenae]NYT84772.1 nuclear transport factor 2 family protein [Pollutimonas harenae]TEA72829.1 nuclear transport factor 2 family protein [Pollutimonas harenae]
MARYSNGLVLPRRVAQFIEATNSGDLSRLLNVFAADAIVNDQLQQWCGAAELRKWAELDVIGQQLTLRPIHCVQHYGHCVVAANADGKFDKRGLPDPLEVLLYFTLAEDRIVQLIILRDRSGTSPFDALRSSG